MRPEKSEHMGYFFIVSHVNVLYFSAGKDEKNYIYIHIHTAKNIKQCF